ncbi:hypothetical protein L218DRAFT_957744 [Marasmius fiardii PR-910]|nr:hypothetical protein L218DRAFT_957744 [Marasmius fiardii PR-910]
MESFTPQSTTQELKALQVPRRIPPSDVYSVWTIFRRRRPDLPDEIILDILRHAEYYAREVSHHCRVKATTFRANDYLRGIVNEHEPTMAGLYMTASVGHDRIKSVAFKMTSGDQGWASFGGNGTYNNSHTWFEASILQRLEQSDHDDQLPLEGPTGRPQTFGSVILARHFLRLHGWDFKFVNGDKYTWKVHHNITAQSDFGEYNVHWIKGEKTLIREEQKGMGIGIGNGEGFVESLQQGDLIVLWARAEQAAWVNIVEQATIVTEYEVS